MKKVTGIGGIFFKCKDPQAMRSWYAEHLGMTRAEDGEMLFEWRESDSPDKKAYTAFCLFKENTDYFNPSAKDYMFNFRVENLEALLEELKKQGVQVIGEIQTFEYGKFGWITDPEGNKIELWEPVDSVFASMYEGQTVH
ncbi:MAG: VOC family protein [Bacteroidia bacterium]|nr:VOC family protein [Bacteroidia bacterium]